MSSACDQWALPLVPRLLSPLCDPSWTTDDTLHLTSDTFVHRGCSELYRMPVSEYKVSSTDSGSFEYKFPFRSNNNKWQRTSSSPQQSLTASPQPHTPNRAISLGSSVGKTLSAERLERGAVIPRSVSSDGRPLDTKRSEDFFLKPPRPRLIAHFRKNKQTNKKAISIQNWSFKNCICHMLMLDVQLNDEWETIQDLI